MNNNSQNRINEIQNAYREWLSLQEKLAQAQQDWQKSVELMQKMQTFYLDGEYQAIYEKIENGENFDLTTQGEHSIMSEDALWNAMHEHDQALWQMLRFAVKHLDKE